MKLDSKPIILTYKGVETIESTHWRRNERIRAKNGFSRLSNFTGMKSGLPAASDFLANKSMPFSIDELV